MRLVQNLGQVRSIPTMTLGQKDRQYRGDPNECNWLRDMFPRNRDPIEALPPLPIGSPEDAQAAVRHFWACKKCRDAIAEEYALNSLIHRLLELAMTSKVWSWEEAVAWEIENTKHDYFAGRHEIMAKLADTSLPPEKEKGLFAERVAVLVVTGMRVREALYYIHEAPDSREFSVFPPRDSADVDEFPWEVMYRCGPFIGTLPRDTQEFVFMAAHAAESCGFKNKYYEETHPESVTPHIQFLCEQLELVGPKLLDTYTRTLKEDMEQGQVRRSREVEATNTKSELQGMHSSMETLRRDFEDQLDSLKATQMEVIRLLEKGDRKAQDCREFVIDMLSSPLAGRLHEVTLNYLYQAEYEYRKRKAGDEAIPSPLLFTLAVENELRIRLLEPIAEKILARGHVDYSLGERGIAVVRNGKVTDLSLGQVLWYVDNDSLVRELLIELGLDPGSLIEKLAKVRPIRNRASHARKFKLEEETKVRDLFLGSETVFKDLFPRGSLL